MIELLNIDCMTYMKGLEDKAFDLAIVDPPYGIGVSSVKKMTSVSKKEYVVKDWDDSVPSLEYFNELRRVTDNQIIWGANFFDGVGLFGGGIVWNKLGKDIGRRKPMTNLSDCEFAFCSMRNNIKMFSYTQIGNVFGNDYQIDWQQNRIHPTQKPVALYRWLLHNYASPGNRILDTHLGSGSSAIAAHQMGFDFVGTEIDKDYFEAATKRYNNAIMQQTLF